MTVHFIGAGPGAADLLTLRGRDIIAACPVCLYAGSLGPQEILGHCPADAKIINTAAMDLDTIITTIKTATEAGKDVARLHSGDLSVWSAMGEQMRRLRAENIAVSVTPGVPSFAAAAAALAPRNASVSNTVPVCKCGLFSITHNLSIMLTDPGSAGGTPPLFPTWMPPSATSDPAIAIGLDLSIDG
jgi:precorrin-4 methylase